MPARELVVLVPGLGRYARYQQKEAFIRGVEHAVEHRVVRRRDPGDMPHGVVGLEWTGTDGSSRTVDVAEAYWNDLVPSLAQQGLPTRAVRGASLLGYWFSPAVMRGASTRKYLTFGLIVSAAVLLFWYLSTLMLFVQAVGTDWTAVENIFEVSSRIVPYFDRLAGWPVWLAFTALMGLLPVALLIDMMDFAKRYTAEEANRPEDPALRLVIVRRVRDQILAAIAQGEYERLTVVAHSFGAVVAVDALADVPLPAGVRLRFITLGSPFQLLCRKASWLVDERKRCLTREDLDEWVDVDSRVDWISTGTGLPEDPRARLVSVRPFGTLIDRIQSRNHGRYFDNPEVGRLIVEG